MFDIGFEDFKDKMKTFTEINKDVVEGRWKGAGFGDYRCSVCDEETSGRPEYCPHCNAYMGRHEED